MFKTLKLAENTLIQLGYHRFAGKLWCRGFSNPPTNKIAIIYKYGRYYYVRLAYTYQEPAKDDNEVLSR